MFAANDLHAGVKHVQDLSGISATGGGSHPGGGTRNVGPGCAATQIIASMPYTDSPRGRAVAHFTEAPRQAGFTLPPGWPCPGARPYAAVRRRSPRSARASTGVDSPRCCSRGRTAKRVPKMIVARVITATAYVVRKSIQLPISHLPVRWLGPHHPVSVLRERRPVSFRCPRALTPCLNIASRYCCIVGRYSRRDGMVQRVGGTT